MLQLLFLLFCFFGMGAVVGYISAQLETGHLRTPRWLRVGWRRVRSIFP